MSAENTQELDQIAAEAAAMEAENAAPTAQPGEPLPPPVDPAQEWRDAANMGCGLVIAMRPELKAEWTKDKLDALGDALNKCAERYGWTVGGMFGHPLVALAFAAFPLAASAVRVERERAEKKQAANPKEPGGTAEVVARAGNLEPAT